jgi:tetratricopeptide (TPR) repeat protein
MPEITVQQALDLALARLRTGALAEAEHLYHLILSQDAHHPDALYFLGLIAHQTHRLELAINLLTKAAAVQPSWRTHNSLADALLASGQYDAAARSYQQAIALNPNSAESHNNLGVAFVNQSKLDQAITAFTRALQIKPDFARALSNVSGAFKDKGQLDQAVTAARRAITLQPDLATAHSNLGNALRDLGHIDESILACKKAIALQPNLVEAHNNLANALVENGEFEQAVSSYRTTLSLSPNHPSARNNLAMALREMGDPQQAIHYAREAIESQPNLADAHFTLGELLLQQGNFDQGWPEMEWRWQCSDRPHFNWSIPSPRWNGSAIAGRTVLVSTEQGFGDIIQFARFLPTAIERGCRLIIACPPTLRPLLQSIRAANTNGSVQHWLDEREQIPAFDVHCPLLTLPLALGCTLATIPITTPYLHPPQECMHRWKAALSSDPAHLKVGLAWVGRPFPKNRSIPPAALTPLLQLPGISFYSLQKDLPSNQPAPPQLIDLSPQLVDFTETSALISQLDLVITIDTVIAHLAGALGKPVWNLLKFSPDWRWMLDRSDSPWYPTMRLFRQPRIGDWDTVIQQVTLALQHFPPAS